MVFDEVSMRRFYSMLNDVLLLLYITFSMFVSSSVRRCFHNFELVSMNFNDLTIGFQRTPINVPHIAEEFLRGYKDLS